MKNKEQSRRQFISTVAMGAAGIGAAGIITGSAKAKAKKVPIISDRDLSMLNQAPDGEVLKAGVIGCGGRGRGAAINFVDAGPNLKITALGDVFPDQLESSRETLKQARDIEIADENCFTGFDNYKGVIDSDIDIAILAAPPFFRPEHVKYAIEAGKHVFQEKPVAVDPYGSRIMEEVTQKARENGLCMVSGTIRRYQKDYIETHRQVANGMIGDVVSANIIRNGGALWWVERKPEWDDMEYMIRNWGNFAWLSGDHIVEMFVHEVDVMSWYVGGQPERAIGYGGRMQRVSGDQFDQFSIVYEYENGRNAHCATRQINGCDNRRSQIITGTNGYADADGKIYNFNDELIWEYPYPENDDPEDEWYVNNPLVQEHVELVTAIRTGNYINDSDEQVKSTRITIMGRMAAYTGREITWDEVMTSDLRLGPETLEFGPVEGIPEEPPVVGTAPPPVNRYG